MQLNDEVAAKVVKQVEFYFSDSNLPKDRFLKGKVAENAEGYVQLRIIIAFARVREMLQLEDSNPEKVPEEVLKTVADVLRTRSKFLVVSEDGTQIRRAQALVNESAVTAEVDSRSLFVKPFPHDVHIDQLTEFFSKYGAVNSVRMRRGARHFKGSVFVELASVEEAEKVLAQTLVYAGATLRMEKKLDYIQRKKDERKQHQNHDDDMSNGELSDGCGGKTAGAISESRKNKAQAGGEAGQKRAREEGSKEKHEESNKSAKVANEGFTMSKGLLLAFTAEEALPNAGGRQLIQDLFGGKTAVKYVEFSEDRTSGTIRFASPESADKAMSDWNAKADDNKMIAGVKGSLRKVEGQEEEEYMQRAASAFENSKGSGKGRGSGGRGGRGGRGGGRGSGGRGRGRRY